MNDKGIRVDAVRCCIPGSIVRFPFLSHTLEAKNLFYAICLLIVPPSARE